MTIELYQDVALSRDLPDHNLRAGDIATLIDFVPHPNGGEQGCILEIFNAVGDSVAMVAVPMSAIKVLQPNEILTVRAFPQSA
ncbi:MAG: DUF4926 domain-containing protein [Cyanobacteria bacterium P01_A01_bin.135]